MTATLARQGTGFALGNHRSYDVWGSVRSGSQTGDPKGRYCANLGHKQDDESGLIYMRARYYEPGSGRFVNEDPKMQGANWAMYCGNNPPNFVDSNGHSYGSLEQAYDGICCLIGFALLIEAVWLAAYADFAKNPQALVLAVNVSRWSMNAFTWALTGNGPKGLGLSFIEGYATNAAYTKIAAAIVGGIEEGTKFGGIAMLAVFAVGLYSMYTLAATASIDADSDFSPGG